MARAWGEEDCAYCKGGHPQLHFSLLTVQFIERRVSYFISRRQFEAHSLHHLPVA